MHASFPWKQRCNGCKCKQSRGKQESKHGAAGSLALDGNMFVPTVTIIANNVSKTNTVCKFNVMNPEDNFE